jgi:hypothetical protein
MPEMTLDEADRCPHCGKILYDPPKCCRDVIAEYERESKSEWDAAGEEFVSDQDLYWDDAYSQREDSADDEDFDSYDPWKEHGSHD